MPDPGRVARWFEAHAAALVLYARQWLDVQSAQDVVQDVFLRLMGQRREPDDARAWLFRAVRNAAVSELRSRHGRRRRETIVAGDQPRWFETHPDDLLDAAEAERLLRRLPIEQREIVVLRLWAGMTLREAADVVGSSAPTVHRRYRDAIKEIRRQMETPCRKNPN